MLTKQPLARVSKSHGVCLTVVQNSSDFAQNLEICMHKMKIYAFQPLLQFFSSCFTFIIGFPVRFFPIFLAQDFNTKKFTAEKKSTFKMSAPGFDGSPKF